MASVIIRIEGLTINTTAPSSEPDINIELNEFTYEANDVEMADQKGILDGFTSALGQILSLRSL